MHCEGVKQQRNVIFTGPAGVGKSYLACALGHQACQMAMMTTLYCLVAKFIEMLRLSHADGSYSRLLEKLAKVQLLILYDWGIDPLDHQARRDLLGALENHNVKSSTIITIQLPVDKWHQFIEGDTIADTIFDRVINNAYTITITGESMIKTKNLTNVERSVIS